MSYPVALSDLANEFGGLLMAPDALVANVSIDSRSIAAGDTFVAIQGENFDGNSFIEKALEKGAAAVVTNSMPNIAKNKTAHWCVEDTAVALGQIAKLKHAHFKGKTIAITGSAGKTCVKEMCRSILAESGSVQATKGNLNNHFGVPLTAISIDSDMDYAVIEMGASALGELSYLSALINSDVALVNNVGDAHIGEFGSVENIAIAKGEIFEGLKEQGTAVVNLDCDTSQAYLKQNNVLNFSTRKKAADMYASDINFDNSGIYSTSFTLNSKLAVQPVQLQVDGLHAVSNALAAAACCSALGIGLAQIADGLKNFVAADGRQKKYLLNANIELIDDTYNASPSAVASAIDMMSLKQGIKIAVLGNMAELGKYAAERHAFIGAYCKQHHMDELYLVGSHAQDYKRGFENSEFDGKAFVFDSKESLSQALFERLADSGATHHILVKGSRSSEMEFVVQNQISRFEQASNNRGVQ